MVRSESKNELSAIDRLEIAEVSQKKWFNYQRERGVS